MADTVFAVWTSLISGDPVNSHGNVEPTQLHMTWRGYILAGLQAGIADPDTLASFASAALDQLSGKLTSDAVAAGTASSVAHQAAVATLTSLGGLSFTP
jgi:hypothetical protein